MRAGGFAFVGDGDAPAAHRRRIRIAFRVTQGEARHRFGMQSLNVKDQIASHGKAHPDGLLMAGLTNHVHVCVRHAIKGMRERAIRVLASAGFVTRNRAFARTGHVRCPDREACHTVLVADSRECGGALVPHAVIHRKSLHQHHGNPLPFAIHGVLQFNPHAMLQSVSRHLPAHASACLTIVPYPLPICPRNVSSIAPFGSTHSTSSVSS